MRLRPFFSPEARRVRIAEVVPAAAFAVPGLSAMPLPSTDSISGVSTVHGSGAGVR